jgi:curli biogenesis system outer membrane secretion channel CsgG
LFRLVVVLLLTASCCGQGLAQTRKPTKGKAPETSSDASFQPDDLTKLAVIAYTEERRGQSQSDQQRLVEDIFVQTLLSRGHLVVARSDLKSVLTEQELENSGLTDGNAVAVGKLLNVPAVLVVRITEYAVETQFDAKINSRTQSARATVGSRLIDVNTGGIAWQGTHGLSDTVQTEGELVQMLVQVAERLARAFPKKSSKPSGFDPDAIDKLAVVMVGDSRRRGSFSSLARSGQQRTDEQRLVEDKLGIALSNKGYALVSRSDLEALMREKSLQESGLTEENVSELGKLLNVPAVMIVRITECQASEFQKKTAGGKKAAAARPFGANSRAHMATAALGVRLISVQTGEVLWCRAAIDSQEVGGKLETSQVLAKVVKKIGDALPQRGSSKKKR